MKQTNVSILKERLAEITHLSSALSVLSWDQEVYMPEKGADLRAVSVSHLSTLIHNKFTSIDDDGLLSELNKKLKEGKISGDEAVIVSETWRVFEREKKLPESYVREIAETCSKAQTVWVEARKKNDFALFLPWLSKIVELKRKEAELVGYADSPYDALIDAFEPGMTARESARILGELKDFLVPFIRKIKNAQKVKANPEILKGNFPIERQKEFNNLILREIGFDLSAGRLDESAHPFSSGAHPRDVRLTTRYKKEDVFYAIGSTIHEAGHGLYEQGLPIEHFGTPLCEAVSLGIHESQSRMWENLIGKSREFWMYFYPKLREFFPKPFGKISLDQFYKAINLVTPSLIRTESDEVTYNLHIIIRFEIELGLIDGSIDPKDLPKIWNKKMKEYLGVEVPNDAAGVLQDVHWSHGGIGYFPTYSFGNLYAAQFFSAMKRDIPDLSAKISTGDFASINDWLRKNIHVHGKTYKAGELVKRTTGKPLSSAAFKAYLEEKYGKIYGLNID